MNKNCFNAVDGGSILDVRDLACFFNNTLHINSATIKTVGKLLNKKSEMSLEVHASLVIGVAKYCADKDGYSVDTFIKYIYECAQLEDLELFKLISQMFFEAAEEKKEESAKKCKK